MGNGEYAKQVDAYDPLRSIFFAKNKQLSSSIQ